MLIKEHVGEFTNKIYRTLGGIWCPDRDIVVPRYNNVLAILRGPRGKFCIPGHNIITDAGDVWYPQIVAAHQTGSGTTNFFGSLYLSSDNWDSGHPAKGTNGNNVATTIAAAEKANDSTFPHTNDTDTDNTGSGVKVLTHKFSYAAAVFTDPDVDSGCIGNGGDAGNFGSAGGTPILLCAFDLSPFAVTAVDTLKMIVNHAFNGV
jgi:hypothetical protein